MGEDFVISTLTAAVISGFTANMLLNLRKLKRFDLNQSDIDLSDLTLGFPVRNEAKNLRDLLPALEAMTPAPFRILFLDDESDDETPELLKEAVQRNSHMRVVRGSPLPNGWRGKVWALEQLQEQCETNWILFMDADVRLRDRNAIGAFYHQSRALGEGFASVFPKYEVPFGASLLVSQIRTHLHYLMPFNADQLPTTTAVAGCGQVMLLHVPTLRELGSFDPIKSTTHDGLKLARMFKAADKPVTTFDGTEGFVCHLYQSFPEAFQGFSRNAWEASGSIIVVAIISSVLIWVFVVPFVFAPLFLIDPFFAAAFVFFLYGQYQMARTFEQSPFEVASAPIRALASVGVHGWGALRHYCGLGTNWKGRLISG